MVTAKPIGANVALIVVVVVACIISAPLLYLAIMALSYGVEKPQINTFSPYPSIQVFDDPTSFIVWKIDDRFSVAFDNGFVIDVHNSPFRPLPQEWTSEVMGEELVVKDKDQKLQFSASSGTGVCKLNVDCRGLKASFTDLQTQKSIRLTSSSAAEVVEFFKAAPR